MRIARWLLGYRDHGSDDWDDYDAAISQREHPEDWALIGRFVDEERKAARWQAMRDAVSPVPDSKATETNSPRRTK
jgi:hypothetical protein